MTAQHGIADGIAAEIKADGAELCRLRDAGGRDLLWDAGPVWPNHSPVLFPIVGELAGNRLLHEVRSYPMGRHGFARRRTFTWEEQGAARCRLSLHDDDATRAVFPFAFRLALTYRIEGGALHVDYEVSNPGTETLPASLGAHPAFRWPLGGGGKAGCRLEFAEPEDAPIRRLDNGLLRPGELPTPVQGRTLPLDAALFEDDAIIMLHPRSSSVAFDCGDAAIEVAWHGFEQLGVWQKPGAGFLCIEPWRGYSSPAGFDAEFMTKPGLMLIPPGESRQLGWSIRPLR